jgi:predicted nucleic acid-binding protein
MVLVDTSAWIDFFRDSGPVASTVEHLIETGQSCYCGPVLTEILRGCTVTKQRNQILTLFYGLEKIDDPIDLWENAGLIGASLSKRGYNVKTLDLLIATFSLSTNIPILTKDKDFKLMKKAGLDLMLYEV